MDRKKESCGVSVENCRRIKIGLAAVLAVTLALVARLFYIQVLCHEEFAETAAVQYQLAVEGLDTRGQIFDRNMAPLTGGTYQYYYIIKTAEADDECMSLLAQTGAENVTAGKGECPDSDAGECLDSDAGECLDSDADECLDSDADECRKKSKYQVFRTETYIENVNRQLRDRFGAYVFRTRTRYEDEQVACHLVGYLNSSEKRGVSGLEYYCEEILRADENRLVLTADGAGNILPGRGPAVIGTEGQTPADNGVVTTIDLGLQRKCESLLEGSAACIVSDGKSGEILSMASSPVFNPNRIADYLTSDSDCLVNKTLQAAYPPGSVFKLVVAAAALEDDACAAARTFECTGGAAVGGLTVRCATAPPGGHGTIDMYEAMAQSCNSYFVQLGQLVEKERIVAMARNLGLGEAVLHNFPEETEGNVPDIGELSDQDISNLSIGQGALLATPLQINRMTAIIARGGADVQLSLFPAENPVSQASSTMSLSVAPEISTYFDTQKIYTSKTGFHQPPQILSPDTAAALQAMMGGVTTTGTASGTDWPVPVWAKTGTAEASLRGQPAKNCWLTGFCCIPAPNAEAGSAGNTVSADSIISAGGRCYVITVMVEDGISGAASALPIFEKIVGYLANHSDYAG